MSLPSASIGISICDEKCYYLTWIPSESGPLIISNGNIEVKNNKIPFDYLLNTTKQFSDNLCFSISLSNNHVKYDFLKSYNDLEIDSWNKDNFYDVNFKSLYDSYLYNNQYGSFNIHILKETKSAIISQFNEKEYPLMNLGVGIFSALEGVRTWYDTSNMNEYAVIKFSKKKTIEILLMENHDFCSYMILKKRGESFQIINHLGNQHCKEKLLQSIESIFQEDFDSINFKIFYYSIGGSKKDIEIISRYSSSKIKLINPFKNLRFDDGIRGIKGVNASEYSEIGNVFRGIDA